MILLGKIRRMRDRLSGIDEPPSCAECLASVVGVTAFGGAKPVVKLSSKTVDLLDRSGCVDPLPYLPQEARAIVTDTSRLFPNPPGGLSSYQGIKSADGMEYIHLVVKQLQSNKIALHRSVSWRWHRFRGCKEGVYEDQGGMGRQQSF